MGGPIDEMLRTSFDRTKAMEDLEGYKSATVQLRILCNCQFMFLYIVAPAVVLSFGSSSVLIPLAGYALFLSVLISINFYFAHRLLWKDESSERVSTITKTLLCPPMGLRVTDIISRDILSRYNPLTVASILSNEKHFASFARKLILDLRYPICDAPLRGVPVAVEEWFRAAIDKHCVAFLRSNGWSDERLLTVPAANNASVRSYCPRCWTQYTFTHGACSECNGVHTERY